MYCVSILLVLPIYRLVKKQQQQYYNMIWNSLTISVLCRYHIYLFYFFGLLWFWFTNSLKFKNFLSLLDLASVFLTVWLLAGLPKLPFSCPHKLDENSLWCWSVIYLWLVEGNRVQEYETVWKGTVIPCITFLDLNRKKPLYVNFYHVLVSVALCKETLCERKQDFLC